MEYLVRYNKSYGTKMEFDSHMINFLDMDDYIQKVNAEDSPYTHKAGHNQFSDWSPQQFQKILGAKQTENSREGDNGDDSRMFEGRKLCSEDEEEIPDSIDWKERGMLTEVQDQGYCGSCWAFVASGTMESAHAIATKKLRKLSNQQLMDCCNEYWGNWGCQGGW